MPGRTSVQRPWKWFFVRLSRRTQWSRLQSSSTHGKLKLIQFCLVGSWIEMKSAMRLKRYLNTKTILYFIRHCHAKHKLILFSFCNFAHGIFCATFFSQRNDLAFHKSRRSNIEKMSISVHVVKPSDDDGEHFDNTQQRTAFIRVGGCGISFC